MIKVEQALEAVLAHARTVEAEPVELIHCPGRVLARDVQAAQDLPPFDRSSLDGYAVRASDTCGSSPDAPARLRIIGDVPAGRVADFQVASGTAARITTGAPIPAGADAVVRLENTREDAGFVLLYEQLQPGDNVAKRGEDVRKGETLLKQGTPLRAPEVGLLAALGESVVPVYRKPRVAILSTGNELVEIHEELSPGKIRNSNSFMLAAKVLECGAIPELLGIAKDDIQDIARKLSIAAGADMILTTGGVSVGNYDLLNLALEKLGARLLFWRVAMKPGTPMLAAVWKGTLIAGLSGNPAAAITSFDLIVRPALLRIAGRSDIASPEVYAVLDGDYRKCSAIRRYLRAHVYHSDGVYRARILAGQRPGILSSMARANGYVVIPENSGPVAAGDRVKVLLTEGAEVE